MKRPKYWSRKKPDNGRIVRPQEQRALAGIPSARLSPAARASLAQIGLTTNKGKPNLE